MFDETKIEERMKALNKSVFRAKFMLHTKEILYVFEKGIDTIKIHAYDLLEKRLAPAFIKNDGKQTPMRGHPVFIAQHATATCCRDCLKKWHHIEKGKQLSQDELDYCVEIIMEWIKKQVKGFE